MSLAIAKHVEDDVADDIATLVEENPGIVLLDEEKYARFIANLKASVAAFVPDLSTATSRKKIASEAYRITRQKTSIDEAGKAMNETRRKEINIVDAKRRTMKADLDAIAADARRPLDQWEKQEEARVDYCKGVLKAIEDCGNGLIGGEPQPFGLLFHELNSKIVINAELGEFEDQARVAHRIALDKLTAALEAHRKSEADRIELEKLRAEKAERDRIDSERALKEVAAREAAERERLEKERQEKLAAEQKAREERAAEQARLAAEQQAQEAIAKAEREKQAAVDKAEAETRAVKAEAERVERVRQEAIRKEQSDREARERDREHRGKLMAEAKTAIMAQGAGEAAAKKIVLAIIAGEIPNVRLEF